jgi:hypothetical protein
MATKKKTHFDCKKLGHYMALTTCIKKQEENKAFFGDRAEFCGTCSPACEQGKQIAEMVNGTSSKKRKTKMHQVPVA